MLLEVFAKFRSPLLAGYMEATFLFNIDRPVIDLWWKIAHGVVYSAERLISGWMFLPLVLVATSWNLSNICFSLARWQRASGPGFNP